jgi:peroxiredoxin
MLATLEEQVRAGEREWLERWTEGPRRTVWSRRPLQMGDRAPDFTLLDHAGTRVRLSTFWTKRPALIIFWRGFGCGCGLARAERLRKEYADYVSGANVVMVGQGEPQRSAAYRAEQELEPPILSDPEERAYRAYGLLEGTAAQVLYDAPREMWAHDHETGMEFQRQRREQGRPLVDNPWLLPGEFVVDTTGIVRLAHRYQHCENYPEPLVVMAAIALAWPPSGDKNRP